MPKSVNTSHNRLRWIGYLEGTSLIILMFVAVPMKHFWHEPGLVKSLGPLHGILFLWYVITVLSVAISEKWNFQRTTWKVLIACIIPFGTFYINRRLTK
jgi:integral membrane protein